MRLGVGVVGAWRAVPLYIKHNKRMKTGYRAVLSIIAIIFLCPDFDHIIKFLINML
jgi:hypothetical protein